MSQNDPVIQEQSFFLLLNDMFNQLNRENNLDNKYKLLVDFAQQLTEASSVKLAIADLANQTYCIQTDIGDDIDKNIYPLTIGLTGWVMKHNQVITDDSMSAINQIKNIPQTTWENSAHSCLILPLNGKRNFTGALICIDKSNHASFSQHDFEILTLFANVATDIIDDSLTFEHLAATQEETINYQAQLLELNKQYIENNRKLAKEAIERVKIQKQLDKYTHELEDLISTRTKELIEARDQAMLANESKSIFVANMSHEIRTPLNAILGYTHILIRDKELSDRLKASLKVIDKSGHHLLNLINEVLDISKIESGKLELYPISFNLWDLVQDLSAMFSINCAEKNIQWLENVNLLGDDPDVTKPIANKSDIKKIVLADQMKLRQVLINLLANAIKFTDDGQIALEVIQQDSKKYYFAVTDTGMGITPEALKHIFEPFHHDKNEMNMGGAGLGLAISQKYVELLGGDLKVESAISKGTKFSFEISLPTVDNPDDLITYQNYDQIKNIAHGQKVKVLIIDDCNINRHVIYTLLNEIGVDVMQAISAAEAYKLIDNGYCPDLIFMDYLMPDIKGDEAIKTIKIRFKDKPIKFVMITTEVFAEDRNYFDEIGCDAFIEKPFKANDIFKVIADVLDIEFQYFSTKNDSVQSQGDVSLSQLNLDPDLKNKVIKDANLYRFSQLKKTFTKMSKDDDKQVQLFSNHILDLIYKHDMKRILKIFEA